jgi:FlaA1/EpsC-like NDP-sugar epimerase
MIYNNLDFNYNKINPEKNLKVIVVGAAGTIGSNYLKEILKFKPKKIVCVDINENGLTELTRDLRSSNYLNYGPEYITYPVNLLHDVFDKIFYSDFFDVVANFSAHKHVRSEKDVFSIEALIRNNVFGAIKLMELCSKRPPKYFFSVSTDKAANPVNIMGASKSLMEKIILSKKNEFRVTTARFANVAFSNGSLLEGFINRIQKNQPLSCPNDIKRFFVSPEQSGQICLLSTFSGKSGRIFFPKLNFSKDQIYFKDIALDFLKDKGYEPYYANSEQDAKDFEFTNSSYYPIFFFKTDTSGEKKHEEFYTENEDYNLSELDSLGYIKKEDITLNLGNLKKDFEILFLKKNLKKVEIVKLIQQYLPDFDHIETGKHLDQKM